MKVTLEMEVADDQAEDIFRQFFAVEEEPEQPPVPTHRTWRGPKPGSKTLPRTQTLTGVSASKDGTMIHIHYKMLRDKSGTEFSYRVDPNSAVWRDLLEPAIEEGLLEIGGNYRILVEETKVGHSLKNEWIAIERL